MATKFQLLKNFVNRQKDEFTRKEMTKWFGVREMIWGTMDQYRNYLTQAGYIKWLSRGKYQRVKYIPDNLSSRQCRREAYKTENWIKGW